MIEWLMGNEKDVEELVTHFEVPALCVPVDTT